MIMTVIVIQEEEKETIIVAMMLIIKVVVVVVVVVVMEEVGMVEEEVVVMIVIAEMTEDHDQGIEVVTEFPTEVATEGSIGMKVADHGKEITEDNLWIFNLK